MQPCVHCTVYMHYVRINSLGYNVVHFVIVHCPNRISQCVRVRVHYDIYLQLCQEDDVRLFTFLLPDIYSQFSNITVGNNELLHLIVSCIDGTQVCLPVDHYTVNI